LLVVKTDEVNFVENPDDLESLIEQIKRPMSGTHYYIPRGSLEL